jgi:riboflavin synthase
MFGGITETIGTITFLENKIDCLTLKVIPQLTLTDLAIGHSIALNGVCLTVTEIRQNEFTVLAVPETRRLTNLELLTIGQQVNLERALAVNSRIGGHFVQGHIDFCGEIMSLIKDGENALLAKISCPAFFAKYIINKGYITLDGMSITVINIQKDYFTVTFIPHTQKATIVSLYQLGTKINILGKYIEKIMQSNNS